MAEDLTDHRLTYTGTVYPRPGERYPEKDGQLIYPYIPHQHLVEAVNLAILLQRPLLIKGEPGCGKTQLARAVAYELKLPFEAWYVKSTSQARDGLYTYDSVSRLRDAQLASIGRIDPKDLPGDRDYVRFGPLGKSFQNNERSVVLIDEIDKADIDFPNDLLLELDEQTFIIDETGETIEANHPPIVFITSNDEKDLPDAFLRRCLFHYVKFPEREDLVKIVRARYTQTTDDLINAIVNRFVELREEMSEKNARKKVSTSELMDWVRVLDHYEDDQTLRRLKGQILYPGVLLKSWDDYRQFGPEENADS